jgi:hypothetical protein
MESRYATGIYTTCDYCNPDQLTENPYLLTDEEARMYEVDSGTEVHRGVVECSFAQASVEGWLETESGHQCPLCRLEEVRSMIEDPESVASFVEALTKTLSGGKTELGLRQDEP